MKISVIIPCRNEQRHIAAFLDSLLAQQIEPDWELEVLVADGMSDDGTREILRQYAERNPAVRLIDNPGRIVSTGLNAAIKASKGSVVIRMDAHTVYASDYVKECVHTLDRTGADNVGGPWVAQGKGIVGKAIAAAFRSRFCGGGGGAHNPDYEGEVDTVYLGCWPRSVFNWAGMFDPHLVRNQDDEFNFRLRRLGGRIWQSPLIRSVYTPRGSFSALFRQYMQYGYWRVVVIRKYNSLASWRHVIPAAFVGGLIALLLATLLAAAAGKFTFVLAAASLFMAAILIHLVAGILASLSFARSLEIRSLILLPIVFAVYHVAYGLGFLAGTISRSPQKHGAGYSERLFTALTR